MTGRGVSKRRSIGDRNRMEDQDMEDVLIVRFDNLAAARAGMSELRRLADEGTVTLRTAAIVVREADGRFWMPEDEEQIGLTGTATGGVIGALLGALTGPIGLLLWGATGALIGSLVDAEQADVAEEVLISVTRSVPPGTTALVADITEPAPAVVDAAMRACGGIVSRRPRSDVESEVMAAEEALRAARAEANRVLRERRKRAGEQTMGDRLSELKDKVTGRS